MHVGSTVGRVSPSVCSSCGVSARSSELRFCEGCGASYAKAGQTGKRAPNDEEILKEVVDSDPEVQRLRDQLEAAEREAARRSASEVGRRRAAERSKAEVEQRQALIQSLKQKVTKAKDATRQLEANRQLLDEEIDLKRTELEALQAQLRINLDLRTEPYQPPDGFSSQQSAVGALIAYIAREGHSNVPMNHQEKSAQGLVVSLGHKVQGWRDDYSRSIHSPHRYQVFTDKFAPFLESIGGWTWTPSA